MAEQTEQAVEPASVEDRLAAQLMGVRMEPEKPESEQPEGEGEATPPADEAGEGEGSGLIEVEFNGQSYQVPPELKDALMATSDYTKKTTEVSQLRRNVELQQKELALVNQERKFHQSVAGDVDQLKMLDAYINHLNTNTNWQQLEAQDAFRLKMELDRYKDQRSDLARKLEGQYAQFRSRVDAERAKNRKDMLDGLSKSIPSWSEESRASIEKYMADQGYSAESLPNMSAMDYQVAWKAMQFDKLRTEAKSAVKNAAAPVVKPGPRANAMPKAVQNKLNYRKVLSKTTNPKERQKLAEDRIGDIFGG